MFRSISIALAIMAMGVAVAPAQAQEVARARPDVAIKPGQTKVLVMRPQIKVGALSTGGLFEPSAEWTDTARKLIGDQLRVHLGGMGISFLPPPDVSGEGEAITNQYRALFPVVAKAVMEFQFFPGNRLPTKKRAGVFDYTLGSGISAMPGAADADYALFLFTEDAYGSAGRKTAQVFAAMLGAYIPPGIHTGYAGLVDLKTGDLVWLNADPQMGGDVREAEGVVKRVEQLLADFPGSVAGAPAAAK